MSSWNDLFCKEKDSYIRVQITAEEEMMLSKTAQRMNKKEEKEYVYTLDNRGISTRWFVGLVGEYAVSKVLKQWGLIDDMPSFDLEEGLSYLYDTADMIKVGFNLGCKTVGIGKAALVKEHEKYPEIISVYDKFQKVVYICGIATPDVLNRYSDLSLVEDDRVRSKAGSVAGKVGFNRFDKLIPFSKENVKRFKVDLELCYHYYLTNADRQNINNTASYIELRGDKLHIRNWMPGFISEEEFDYPLSNQGLKRLTKVLDPNRIYIGFQITPILEKLQSEWVGDSFKLQVIDMCSVLSKWGSKYKTICNDIKAEEAIGLLSIIFNPTPPFPTDSINANFYMFLRILFN